MLTMAGVIAIKSCVMQGETIEIDWCSIWYQKRYKQTLKERKERNCNGYSVALEIEREIDGDRISPGSGEGGNNNGRQKESAVSLVRTSPISKHTKGHDGPSISLSQILYYMPCMRNHG